MFFVFLLLKFHLFLTLYAYQVSDPNLYLNVTPGKNDSLKALHISNFGASNGNKVKEDTLNKTESVLRTQNATSTDNKNAIIATEGGAIKPKTDLMDKGFNATLHNHGRENEMIDVHEVPTIKPTTDQKINDSLIKKENGSSIAVFTDSSEKNDNKKTVPRKGVPPETSSNSSTSATLPTNTTTKSKKPTLTVSAGNLDESKSKANSSNTQALPKVPVDMNTNKERQKYIVPIVAVILSVPFVAIIISVIYKRGADWWRYRHYRRMDFLINGMYDP